jgi:hypothetical protein
VCRDTDVAAVANGAAVLVPENGGRDARIDPVQIRSVDEKTIRRDDQITGIPRAIEDRG